MSAVELVAIARELRRRVEWFVEPGPPAIVSYRSRSDVATQAIDVELESIVRDVEFVVSNVPALVKNPPTAAVAPGSNPEADALAGEARVLLGLELDVPAHDLARLVEAIGLLAFSVPLGEGADAGTVLLPGVV